jgi:hypothetical protein
MRPPNVDAGGTTVISSGKTITAENSAGTHPRQAETVCLTLRPHVERGGYHLDRFDALLDGEVICTSRSGWHTPARVLLRRGYPPDDLLQVQHEGRPLDPTIVVKPIGELAKWEIEERDRGGLKRRTWRPFDASRLVGVASPARDRGSAAPLLARR